MNIPPFWASADYKGKGSDGHTHEVRASGWSFVSMREAREAAAKRARHVFDLMTGGGALRKYEYHDRPIREEILKQIGAPDTPAALVTRNRYGALVLNTPNVLFVDVDFHAAPAPGLLQSILSAFSRKRRETQRQEAAAAQTKKIEAWAAQNPGRGFRLYRTKEGLRLLFTDRLYDPLSDETAKTLEELEADPLYVKLTRKQACFRARLTAKPWRCGAPNPPVSFPREGPQAEARFRKWETEYTKSESRYKVCTLLTVVGAAAEEPAIRTIVEAHDRGTRVDMQAELA